MKILLYLKPHRAAEDAKSITLVTGTVYLSPEEPEPRAMVGFDGTHLFLLSQEDQRRITAEITPKAIDVDWFEGSELLERFVAASLVAIQSAENILAQGMPGTPSEVPLLTPLTLQPVI